jgi:hypothetical protein
MSLWDAATDFFNQASGAIRPREILANYNYLVRQMVYYRKRLKNPVDQRNGKPLAQITIKTELNFLEQDAKAYRMAIRLLIMCGYLKGKDRGILRDYVRKKNELNKLRDKYQELLDGGHKKLKQRAAVLATPSEQVKPKKKSPGNNIGLKVLDGGKKFEDDPPFATP